MQEIGKFNLKTNVTQGPSQKFDVQPIRLEKYQ